MKHKSFKTFLSSLKTTTNKSLIEAISNGYQAIYESPTAEVMVDDNLEDIDFHIEDILANEGEYTTIEYINGVLNSLEDTNETIEINKEYLRGDELAALPDPQNSFVNRFDKDVIISRLKMIRDNLRTTLRTNPVEYNKTTY